MYFQAATIPSSIANAIENVAKIHKTAIKTIFIYHSFEKCRLFRAANQFCRFAGVKLLSAPSGNGQGSKLQKRNLDITNFLHICLRVNDPIFTSSVAIQEVLYLPRFRF